MPGIIEVRVLDDEEDGPVLFARIDERPLVMLYAHGYIDEKFINTFVEATLGEIIRHGGEVAKHDVEQLVAMAFHNWQNDLIDNEWPELKVQGYLN